MIQAHLDLCEDVSNQLLESFSHVKFYDHYQGREHIYIVDGEVEYPSTSKKLTQFYKPFDRNIAFFVAKKRGVSKEQVLSEWDAKRDASCERGTRVHNFAEAYMQGCKKPTCNQELGVVHFIADLPSHIVPIVFELPLCTKRYKYAGTSDVIFLNLLTGNLILGDWKTNEDLFKNYKGQKMLKPFNKLLDTPYNKYQLQLSHYEICLREQNYEVEERWLIWLRLDESTGKYYQKYSVESFVPELDKLYGYDDW